MRIDARFTSADKKRKAPASLAAAGAFETRRSSQIADCNGRAEGIERGLPALRARYRELAERFNDTRSRVEQALGRLREVPNTLSELAQDIARKLGKPLFDPDSLDYQMREVTRMAMRLDRDRPHVPQQRGREAR